MWISTTFGRGEIIVARTAQADEEGLWGVFLSPPHETGITGETVTRKEEFELRGGIKMLFPTEEQAEKVLSALKNK